MNTTLLIDGNWLLMSRASVMLKKFSKSNETAEILRARDELVDLMAQSIYRVLQIYNTVVDDIVLVADGGSWRKSVERPAVLENTIYKGTRYKDDDVDFRSVYDALEILRARMSDAGYTTAKMASVEGDDWMAAYCDELTKRNRNTVIWSTDRDLQQLIRNDGDTFVAWTDGNKKAVLDKTLCNNDVMDIMLNFDAKPFAYDAFVSCNYEHSIDVEYIEPEKIAIEKIICGDSSDNIPAIIIKQSGTKRLGISTRECQKIIESANISHVDDIIERKGDILNEARSIKRLFGTDYTDNDILDCIEYNVRMIRLGTQYMPAELRESVINETSCYDVHGIKDILLNYKSLYNGDDSSVIEQLIENLR